MISAVINGDSHMLAVLQAFVVAVWLVPMRNASARFSSMSCTFRMLQPFALYNNS